MDAVESNEVKKETMSTIVNGQLMQYCTLTEDAIYIKLDGVDNVVTIVKEDSMYDHYRNEYEALIAGMGAQVEQREKAKADAEKANANLEIVKED